MSQGTVVDHSSSVRGVTSFVDSDLTASREIISALYQSPLDRAVSFDEIGHSGGCEAGDAVMMLFRKAALSPFHGFQG